MSSFTVNSGNSNIISLFSSMSSSQSTSLGNLTSTIAGLTTDYSSIKNGAYGKVAKAYYAKQAEETKEEKTSESKKDTEEKETVESAKEKAKTSEKSSYSGNALYNGTVSTGSIFDSLL